MVNHELQQERFRHEEQENIIQQDLREGRITEEEAQQRLARGRMHLKIDEEGSAFRIDEATAAGAGYQTTQHILEEVLDTKDKIWVTRWVKNITGFAWLKRKADIQKGLRQRPDYKHRFPRIEILVHGKPMRVNPGEDKKVEEGCYFEYVLGFILGINCALIGTSVSVDEGPVYELLFYLEHAFTLIFTLELILRLLSDGWIWIMEPMNFMDFLLITITGILPMWILGPIGIQSGGAMRMMQVLRALRLIKLVRMVRTIPAFRIFWKLLRGMMDSGPTLFWTYVILIAVLYVFAIFAVFLIGKNEAYDQDPEVKDWAHFYFGTVPKAFITLFQVMTLDSWSYVARPLMQYSDFVSPFFIIFIMVCVLCLGNLITAVIIQNAEEKEAQDTQLQARLKREQIQGEIDELKEIFMEIDEDGSGMLSKEEYDEALAMNRGGVTTKFELLGIAEDERDEIFDLLDTGSGEISVEMFAQGLRDMQGEAKAKDSFTICKKVDHINKNLGNLSVRLKRQQESAEELKREINEAHRQMGGLLVEMKEVMGFLAVCIPAPEVKKLPAVPGNPLLPGFDHKKNAKQLDKALKEKRDALAQVGLPQEPSTGALRPARAQAKQKVQRTVGFAEQIEEVSPEKEPPTSTM